MSWHGTGSPEWILFFTHWVVKDLPRVMLIECFWEFWLKIALLGWCLFVLLMNCLTERKYAIQHHVIENKRAAMRIPTTVTHDVTTPSQESVDFSEPNSPVSTANSTGSLSHGIGKFWWQYWWDFLLHFWCNRLACKKLSLIRSSFCHF